ncbi:hypothetical protein AOQ84DRAFT_196928 [Glonium stellatum]|uniref:Uncharacterized protein n=1 Tax=Glonium stellatum TaxID=574774 RepID=A0A8E2F6B3_9PEZI|nr:hypothetical protein AOQ84DRAFT_196928 [Glonium stellatum]
MLYEKDFSKEARQSELQHSRSVRNSTHKYSTPHITRTSALTHTSESSKSHPMHYPTNFFFPHPLSQKSSKRYKKKDNVFYTPQLANTLITHPLPCTLPASLPSIHPSITNKTPNHAHTAPQVKRGDEGRGGDANTTTHTHTYAHAHAAAPPIPASTTRPQQSGRKKAT